MDRLVILLECEVFLISGRDYVDFGVVVGGIEEGVEVVGGGGSQ